MSDPQPEPSHLPASPDISHARTTQWSADGKIDDDQSSADEQDDEMWSTDEQSSEESSADDWSYEGFNVTGIRIFRGWWDARFQDTLPLALSDRIPLEVFEFVIDAMIGDQPTSAAAALVCTMWYPRAMHSLYYAVEIRSRTNFNILFKQCHASPRVKQSLASTCRLLANFGGHHNLQALPSALVGVMPRVRILHIENGRLRFIRADFFLALSRFKSVTSLTLGHCLLNNITQLRQIVSAFPQLTDLTIDVRFAQEGAASYAGAPPFQPSSHIRLRYLNIDVHRQEIMAMFLDWMTQSGLCTSLAGLTFRQDADYGPPSVGHTPLSSKLLEAAGASLTRYWEVLDHDNAYRFQSNLLQNTSLRSWNFTLRAMEHSTRDMYTGQTYRAWIEAIHDLSDIFSTIRSRQLERIAVCVPLVFDYNFLAYEKPSAVLKSLNLEGLHEVMSRPYFDALQDVEVRTYLSHRMDPSVDVVISEDRLEPIFGGILQPWSARGVVTVTYRGH
ncbi:uncharacterized protein B0H18DRAFT_1125313 [Fomitopsis serialis]|uniref:uncharacterized protein n=1 Tax=Fomitopsis serialis TaxID=139415 RepID=UPI00200729D5|nr:uncharacterized protein B0H18DRAFT_1125313 [Neoantrodia serialis]KAH9914727.1 hypothetical protein B0H18DRAFT_1125313 [Neoantrodia serialis]